MFIWPDENAPDGATWTGSFNQAEWDAYLASRKESEANKASDSAPAKTAAKKTAAKKTTPASKDGDD